LIGIDTNVFIRFALNDNARQHAAALALLGAADETSPIFVHPLVWVEAEWLLRKHYKLSRAEIADRLSITLRADCIVMPDPDACEAALNDYRANKADLVECLLAQLNRVAGCEVTFTFDKDATRLEHIRLLKT
jgi:predicted nucleic-acid-binding protein